ncbi:MAG: glycosyltransferase family 39 protein [Chloroflexota bacterium]|nr:glycosyltransferase family 39 protein [Dehalococcoidia bacterium]MDW8252755.1 glycosyltransferase family 39 protein [Chloroflexota bacterium]
MPAARQLRALAPLVIVTLLWAGGALLTQPWGEFPLNDDWDYAKSARALAERGAVEISPEARVTLVAQAAWGALFSLPFGWSFFALRLSTLTAGLLGVLATYGLARLVGAARPLAAVAALSVAFCPLYFGLAFTFMTDVPSTAVLALGLLALGRWLRQGRWSALLAGTAWSAVAVLIRPTGLAMPAAFALAALRSALRRSRRLVGLIPLAAAAGALALWQLWALAVGLSGLANLQAGELRDALARGPLFLALETLRNSAAAALYLGLFLFPLAVAGGAVQGRAAVLSALGGLAGLGLALAGVRFPLAENVFYDLGLGPLTLRDSFFGTVPAWARGPEWVPVAATTLAGAGAAALGVLMARGARRLRQCGGEPLLALAAATIALSFAPLAVAGFLDRYLIALLPPVVLLAAAGGREVRRGALIAAAAVLLLFAGFGVAATRDYFSWNRARWLALERLLERGVPPTEIDGGFEFNGWFTYDPVYRRDPAKSWWWVVNDRYIVAFDRLPGYREVDREPFLRLLPPAAGAVVVLEREQ